MEDEKDVCCQSFFGNIIERKFLCKNLYCQVVDGRLVADGELQQSLIRKLQQPLILPAISVEIFVDDIANKDARRIDYRIYSKDIVNDNNISSLIEEIRKNGGRFSEEIDKKYKFIKAFDGEKLEKKAKLEDDKGQVMEDLLKGIINLAERIESLEKNVCSLKEKISSLPNGQIFPNNNNNNDVILYLIKRIEELEKKMSNPNAYLTTIS